MKDTIIEEALRSCDPNVAEKAFREIDSRFSGSTNPAERAGLLLSKAVLLGVLLRFDDAREQLALASQQTPNDDPDFQLNLDFIAGSLFDQEGLPHDALFHLTVVLSKHAEKLRSSEFRSTYEDIQLRRALDSVRVEEFRNAIPLLNECLTFKLEPQDRSNILCNLGLSHSQLKNYDAARDFFLGAIEIGLVKEWEGEVHCRLGIAYAHLNMLREAKRELKVCEDRVSEGRIPTETIYAWLSKVCEALGEKAESERYSRLARPI